MAQVRFIALCIAKAKKPMTNQGIDLYAEWILEIK